jgi:L-threonylcarbamoyladenylate synthase
VAAPSANRFGRVSPTSADHVREDLGDDVDLVVDGGRCTVGVESTIVDCTGAAPAVLRIGGVAVEDVERVVGGAVGRLLQGEVAAPGTLAAHYAPSARVEVVEHESVAARAATLAEQGQRVGVLALALAPSGLPPFPPDAHGVVVLPAPTDADDYARVLYQRLREADAHELDVLLAVPPPDSGIGAAVRDRLSRAAAG